MSSQVGKPVIDPAIAEPGVTRPTQDETLAHITRTIVEGVHPRRIVLFGSRARGDGDEESDYDIMVEMESDQRRHERAAAIHLLFSGPDRPVPSMDLFVYTPEEVAYWKDQVGLVLYSIEREGRVLYARGDANGDAFSATTGRAQSVREPAPKRGNREVVEMLAGKAESDLLNIEKSLAPGRVPWDTVCFHAQQATEKYLKALLVSRGIHPPHTHKLLELLAACVSAGAEVSMLRADCATLTRYAVEPRYTDLSPPIEESEGRGAAAAAHRVRDVIRPLLDLRDET